MLTTQETLPHQHPVITVGPTRKIWEQQTWDSIPHGRATILRAVLQRPEQIRHGRDVKSMQAPTHLFTKEEASRAVLIDSPCKEGIMKRAYL